MPLFFRIKFFQLLFAFRKKENGLRPQKGAKAMSETRRRGNYEKFLLKFFKVSTPKMIYVDTCS